MVDTFGNSNGKPGRYRLCFCRVCRLLYKIPAASRTRLRISLYTCPWLATFILLRISEQSSVAIIVIIFLTGVNYIGVVFGGRVQTVVTYIKIFSILANLCRTFIFRQRKFFKCLYRVSIPQQTMTNFISMIGLAFAGAFWAYDAWNNVTFVAGEVKNPQRNVGLALF